MGKTYTYKDHITPMRIKLNQLYPQIFSHPSDQKADKKPLSISIHESIIEENPELDPQLVKVALKDYCKGPRYHRACLDNRYRVALDGLPDGIVTPEEHKYHSHRLMSLEESSNNEGIRHKQRPSKHKGCKNSPSHGDDRSRR